MRYPLLLALLLLVPACANSSEGDGDGVGGSGGGDASENGEDGEGGGDGDGGAGGGDGDGGAEDTYEPIECTEPRPSGGCTFEGMGDVGYCCDALGTWSCCPTPLVLSFDGAPITYASSDLVGFDLIGDGVSMASDWPSASTPWLALDRDGDGSIADGTELFGSAVRLSSGRRASHGFEALAKLDSNGDARIDAGDARFGDLLVWADLDADRATAGGELMSASGSPSAAGAGARRVVSIDLAYQVRAECDARGNCGVERAPFVWADASGREHLGEVVDVHLPLRLR